MHNIARSGIPGLVAAVVGACGGGGGSGLSGPPAATTPPVITTTPVFTALSFSQPVALLQAPGSSARWFVAEKGGRIRVFDNNANASSAPTWLDLSAAVDTSGEGGLLGMAFHPDFPATPEVYVSYTRTDAPLESVISRFTSTDNGNTLNPASEAILLTVLQPQANHNGGHIVFGPDGLLYIGFGDGGGAGDPLEYGQDTTNLFGTIVRIDVDVPPTYGIPPGNPFSANAPAAQGFCGAPCPEIFAWGLRNPWRFSFDRGGNRLYAGDVGQNAWEEIDVITAGDNYGWNDREGAHCFDPPSGCATSFIDPVTEYDRSLGNSVTGGFVYRGSNVPDLVGWYLFGDFGSGRLLAIRADATAGTAPRELLDTDFRIVSFAEDNAGELYFLDFLVGTIHRVDGAP